MKSKNKTAPPKSGAKLVRKIQPRNPLDSDVKAGGNIKRPFVHSNANGPLVGKRSGTSVAKQYGIGKKRPNLTITKY